MMYESLTLECRFVWVFWAIIYVWILSFTLPTYLVQTKRSWAKVKYNFESEGVLNMSRTLVIFYLMRILNLLQENK